MSPPALLCHPVPWLVAVSAAIGLAWYALGYPVAMPRSPLATNEKLDCLSYVPFRPGQSPADPSIAISPVQIEEDLARLAPHTSCVRTYTVGMGLARVPEIARKFGLVVLQGVSLGRDPAKNRAEIEAAVALARAQRPAIRALVVGSEVLSRHDMSALELAQIIRRVRTEARVPVTYADKWEAWLQAGELLTLVDFVALHVRPYAEDFPVAASDAARRLAEIRTKVAASFAGKEIMIAETGWPSAGRMREAALPSPSNQARAIHDLIAAAKAGGFRINLFEAFDQPWRRRLEGTAGAHLGLFAADTRATKFRWGGAVSDHPYWQYQGAIGILFAFVIFAAAFFAARSRGPASASSVDWMPVAAIALASGLPVGRLLVEVPLQSDGMADWFHWIFLLLLATATPPVAAAAVARQTRFQGFAAVFDPLVRRSIDPLGRILTLFFALTVIEAVRSALGLVFDSAGRDFPGLALAGSALALAVVAWNNPPAERRDSAAEAAAAIVLAAAAVFIAIHETVWNWQAQWFAVVLLALAWSCRRARGVRSS
jgi:glucan 1,3-beta-glucosidase